MMANVLFGYNLVITLKSKTHVNATKDSTASNLPFSTKTKCENKPASSFVATLERHLTSITSKWQTEARLNLLQLLFMRVP